MLQLTQYSIYIYNALSNFSYQEKKSVAQKQATHAKSAK